MKTKLSTLVFVGVLIGCVAPMLTLSHFGAQTDQRGMRVQPASQGERRVALVIGNSAYKESPLLNPVNDARDVAAALRGLGFEVVFGENLSQTDMKRNIRVFGEKLRNGGVGLFYYAGHGIQVRGSNYLVPVNANITSEEEVEYESVDVGFLLAQMENARNRLNIVILDACRNNPFARSFRSTQKGLASIDAPGGTLISYATAPGSVASDGAGRNGLYTQELLKYMKQPELSIEQLFKQVRTSVRSRTEGKQIPWESSSLEGDFYFSSSTSAKDAPKNSTLPAFDPAAIELEFWNSIKTSMDTDDFKEYLTKYPSGTFAGLARNKIRVLEAAAKSVSPATNPPPANSGNTQPGSSSANRQEHVEVQTYTETAGGVGIEMLRVPSGKFLMGSPGGTGESDERPQHEVTVSSFWMGKYEVTQAQWRAVARLPKVGMDLNPEPSNFKGDDRPVEQVNWDDAVEFCARLSQATGKTYRLPTEAEWEYACRANTRGDYAGDLDEMAWYDDNSAKATHPVGRKRANGFGLYDMHGNVWEWCRDWYSETYYSQSASEDPRGPGSGSPRVLRGGSWYDYALNCRSANRLEVTPDDRSGIIGFRVVVAARTP